MTKPNIKELATVGAQARLTEIRDEQAALLVMFPELRGGWARKAAATAAPAAKTRKRKPMSAAQKKAVGERMRKYWAARRAAKANGDAEAAQAEPGAANGSPSRKSGRKTGRKQGRKK